MRKNTLPDTDEERTSRGSQAAAHNVVAAVTRALEDLVEAPLAPGLYLVATPIGNLGDTTLRALAVLARCDLVYCEDTRHSARLFQHFGLSVTARPLHDHNEESEAARVVAELAKGRRIALVSDAGMPLVSDPGFKLVRAVVAAAHAVTVVPGPSALTTALAASGLPADAFFFAGFLPPKEVARRARLAELKEVPGTLVFFESPQRAAETLADMAEILGARAGVMARELTKLHEEFARGPLSELAQQVSARGELKGEVVLLAGPPLPRQIDDESIRESLRGVLPVMTVKDAAKAVAQELDVQKSRVYALAVAMKNERP